MVLWELRPPAVWLQPCQEAAAIKRRPRLWRCCERMNSRGSRLADRFGMTSIPQNHLLCDSVAASLNITAPFLQGFSPLLSLCWSFYFNSAFTSHKKLTLEHKQHRKMSVTAPQHPPSCFLLPHFTLCLHLFSPDFAPRGVARSPQDRRPALDPPFNVLRSVQTSSSRGPDFSNDLLVSFGVLDQSFVCLDGENHRKGDF